MKKIMILGCSILQLPAIVKAKEMGLTVIGVDMDTDAIGFKYVDYCEFISTNDIEEVLLAAKKHNIDGIMTLASDMPMRTVAVVANELDLVGVSIDTALKATNKGYMRECLKNNNIPIPNYYRVFEKEEYLQVLNDFDEKCILKPADNSGSRGIYLLDDLMDIESVNEAFNYSKKYSKSGEILVEEYMEGPEVSVETISINGECYVIQITDKLTTGAPHFIELGHSQPTMHSKKIVEEIEKLTINAVNAIGIENGPAHTEIKITKDGPKIVELGARLGGDNISTHLVLLSTGIDMVDCSLKISLGKKPDLTKKYNKASAIRYFETKPGKIESIQGLKEAENLKGIMQISFTKHIGDKVDTIKNSSDRIGFVISQGDNAKQAIDYCKAAIDKVKIEIKR